MLKSLKNIRHPVIIGGVAAVFTVYLIIFLYYFWWDFNRDKPDNNYWYQFEIVNQEIYLSISNFFIANLDKNPDLELLKITGDGPGSPTRNASWLRFDSTFKNISVVQGRVYHNSYSTYTLMNIDQDPYPEIIKVITKEDHYEFTVEDDIENGNNYDFKAEYYFPTEIKPGVLIIIPVGDFNNDGFKELFIQTNLHAEKYFERFAIIFDIKNNQILSRYVKFAHWFGNPGRYGTDLWLTSEDKLLLGSQAFCNPVLCDTLSDLFATTYLIDKNLNIERFWIPFPESIGYGSSFPIKTWTENGNTFFLNYSQYVYKTNQYKLELYNINIDRPIKSVEFTETLSFDTGNKNYIYALTKSNRLIKYSNYLDTLDICNININPSGIISTGHRQEEYRIMSYNTPDNKEVLVFFHNGSIYLTNDSYQITARFTIPDNLTNIKMRYNHGFIIIKGQEGYYILQVKFNRQRLTDLLFILGLSTLGFINLFVLLGYFYYRYESNKMKLLWITITKGIAHDIRKPLTNIELLAKMIEQNLHKKQFQDDFIFSNLKKINKNRNRIHSLTEELFDFNDTQNIFLGKININDVLGEIAQFTKSIILDKIEFQYSIPDEKIIVAASYNQIKKAIMNVIYNSLEAMPDGGRLELISENKKDKAIIKIIDNGAGINRQDQKYIYDLNFTTKETGKGFGLYMAKYIFLKHKGKIKFKSEAGKGTVFTIILPIKKEYHDK